MKKTLLATGVIVALGAIWAVGAWYTGKQLEGRLAETVSQANAQIKRNAPDANVELSAQDYKRSLFSSTFTLQIKPIAGTTSPWLKLGQSVILHENVDHGPFPLAQLKSFSLAPAMTSVHTQLVNNDVTKALFEMAKGESPFVVETRIGYSGYTHSDINLRALNMEKDGRKVVFSGGNFRVSADKEGNAVAVSGEAQSGLVDAVNEFGQKVQLLFNNFKTDGSSEISAFDERTGSQKMNLEKLSISIENKGMAVLEGIEITAKSDVADDKENTNTQFDYTLNSLKVQGQDLGNGKLTLKVGQIDGTAWHQAIQQYEAQIRALMALPEIAQAPKFSQQKATEAFLGVVPLLLKGEPVITIAPLSWKNTKGESTFNLSLFLKDPATTANAPQTLAQQVDRNIKCLDGKLSIPVDMATELMTQVAKLQGYQQEDAAKLANQQVKGLATMGQMFRITTLENNTIFTSLQYTNGQVTLNGEKMPLEQFVGMFGLPSQQSALPGKAVPPAPAIPQQ